MINLERKPKICVDLIMKQQIVVMELVLRFIAMMSWEETIVHIREQSEYRQLVEDAYYSKDPLKSFQKFYQGEEYHATKACFKAEADVELSFENFFGLVKGVFALYFLATFLILLLSVETI